MTDKVQGRIFGGEEVDSIIQFPFVVQVTTTLTFCSGVIISENYILTTAQCIYFNQDPIEVRAGSVVRGEGFLIPIAEAVYHPDNSFSTDYDIAYMRTETPLVFGEDMEPGVLVMTRDRTPILFNVTGWGKRGNEISNERYNVLRTLRLLTVSKRYCESEYRERSPVKENLGMTTFCGEAFDSEGGACDGDAGSPASVGYLIYGLFSFSLECKGPTVAPSVFTDLQDIEIREFITEGTGVEYENH
ncbi:trypsin 5G1-like [Maniola jurtina]|uniref:trypsin 5G1-like n=1 Tax=Maniola jurtina TaxID=191418 RepID=UPI001E68F299|nr:trypsin 5G1-like [Maniola jurtina]